MNGTSIVAILVGLFFGFLAWVVFGWLGFGLFTNANSAAVIAYYFGITALALAGLWFLIKSRANPAVRAGMLCFLIVFLGGFALCDVTALMSTLAKH